MKQNSTILSTCIALIMMSSCSLTREAGTTAQKSAKPEFIDGIALDGGTSNVKLTQKKQIYSAPKSHSGVETNLEDLESADERLDALSKIRLGKAMNLPLYTFIEEWYGVPYRFGGTTKRGIDCSAFVRELYENVYHLGLLRTSVEQFSTAAYIHGMDNLKEGDLVFFKIRSRRISHVGVYLGDGKFVHASSSKGVVISDLNDRYWVRYYAGGGRMG